MVKSLAIGHFDGMHLGHIELFKRLCENGAILVIEKDKPKLTPKREEFVKFPIYYKNINDIKEQNGSKFISNLRQEFPNLKRIVVGYDFKFGFNKSSNASDLQRFFQGEVVVVDEVFCDKISVHTSKIKQLLEEGNISKASCLLGRRYFIQGSVIKGQGIGQKELFATLNLDTDNYFLPAYGVYATISYVNDKSFKSVTFIGNRDSTDSKFSVETHILEKFEEETKSVKVEFIEFIRKNIKFSDLKELKAQISQDIVKANNILGAIK